MSEQTQYGINFIDTLGRYIGTENPTVTLENQLFILNKITSFAEKEDDEDIKAQALDVLFSNLQEAEGPINPEHSMHRMILDAVSDISKSSKTDVLKASVINRIGTYINTSIYYEMHPEPDSLVIPGIDSNAVHAFTKLLEVASSTQNEAKLVANKQVVNLCTDSTSPYSSHFFDLLKSSLEFGEESTTTQLDLIQHLGKYISSETPVNTGLYRDLQNKARDMVTYIGVKSTNSEVASGAINALRSSLIKPDVFSESAYKGTTHYHAINGIIEIMLSNPVNIDITRNAMYALFNYAMRDTGVSIEGNVGYTNIIKLATFEIGNIINKTPLLKLEAISLLNQISEKHYLVQDVRVVVEKALDSKTEKPVVVQFPV